jgi:peptide/nickel transport system ATP-binding protein
MYAGRIVEVGPVREVIKHAKHPYTRGLMGSIPIVGHDMGKLAQIEGSMPRLTEIPDGCPFHPRCPDAFERCRRERPELIPVGSSQAACWLHAADSPA